MTMPLASLSSSLGSRLLAGAGTLALLAGVGLFASRPARTAPGPVPVAVSNTVENHDIDNPAVQPFQYTLAPFSGSSKTATDSYTVPAGKRLVIEYYSAQLTQYPAGGYSTLYLITTVGGSTAYYKVVPPASSTDPISQVTRIYADPGTTVQGYVVASSGTSSGGNVILSGHFVNVP